VLIKQTHNNIMADINSAEFLMIPMEELSQGYICLLSIFDN